MLPEYKQNSKWNVLNQWKEYKLDSWGWEKTPTYCSLSYNEHIYYLYTTEDYFFAQQKRSVTLRTSYHLCCLYGHSIAQGARYQLLISESKGQSWVNKVPQEQDIFFKFPLLINNLPLTGTSLSPSHEVCYSPKKGEHYHNIGTKLEASVSKIKQ